MAILQERINTYKISAKLDYSFNKWSLFSWPLKASRSGNKSWKISILAIYTIWPLDLQIYFSWKLSIDYFPWKIVLIQPHYCWNSSMQMNLYGMSCLESMPILFLDNISRIEYNRSGIGYKLVNWGSIINPWNKYILTLLWKMYCTWKTNKKTY